MTVLDEINVHESNFSTSTPWIQENSINQIVATDFGYPKFDFWSNCLLATFCFEAYKLSFQTKTYERMKKFYNLSLLI